MYALSTDYRMQRAERGYLCAPEVVIGVFTPSPELSLFRHSIPAHAFYETVLHGKRWSATEAVAAGVVHAAIPGAELKEQAFKAAAQLAQLAKNRKVCVQPRCVCIASVAAHPVCGVCSMSCNQTTRFHSLGIGNDNCFKCLIT